MLEILGKKIGMTEIFNDEGRALAVTVIEAGPCPVLSVKDKHIQLGFDAAQESRLKKPILGYFKKINITPLKFIREVLKETGKEYKVGDEIKADLFTVGDSVNITGVSKGKGFQGGMKRWKWHGGSKTHGSTSHRRIGSIGASTSPGRVFKGQHLPGHMGLGRVTVKNLKIVKVDAQHNVILVNGPVPGGKNSYLIVRKAQQKKKAGAPK